MGISLNLNNFIMLGGKKKQAIDKRIDGVVVNPYMQQLNK